MNTILCICFIAAVWGNAVSIQITNTWARYTALDGFLASPGNVTTARSIVHCASFCNHLAVCQSYFFSAGQQESNCQLHSNIFLNTSEMIQAPNATYYIPANYSLPSFECHLNDELYHTVQLSDTTTFTYKLNEAMESYDNAIIACSGDGGMLVQVNTAAKLEMIQAIMSCPSFALWNMYYVDGLYDVNSDSWYFSDSNLTTFPNPFWKVDEPLQPNLNPCVILAGPKWLAASAKSNTPYAFICEK